MDLINNKISLIGGGVSQSSKETKTINRITLFTIGKCFLYNIHYQDDVNAIPNPVLDYDSNTFIYFISRDENTATIDWGGW